jgi:hypothetical protein
MAEITSKQFHVIAVDEDDILKMEQFFDHSQALGNDIKTLFNLEQEHWESLKWTKICVWMENQSGNWVLIDSWNPPTRFLGTS